MHGEKDKMAQAGIQRKVGRCIFKFMRMKYAGYVFYFLPYTSVFMPYVVNFRAAHNV